MKAHPDPNGSVFRPRMVCDCSLRIERCRNRLRCRRKHDEEGIPLGSKLRAPMRDKRLAKYSLLGFQNGRETIAQSLNQPRAPLDIAKEKRYRSRRQIRSFAHGSRPLCDHEAAAPPAREKRHSLRCTEGSFHGASQHHVRAPGESRTPDLLIRSYHALSAVREPEYAGRE